MNVEPPADPVAEALELCGLALARDAQLRYFALEATLPYMVNSTPEQGIAVVGSNGQLSLPSQCMLDTGSSTAVIDADYALSIGIRWHEEPRLHVKSFDTTEVKTLGLTNPVKMVVAANTEFQTEMEVTFVVMKNVSSLYDVLLGQPQLRHVGGYPDPAYSPSGGAFVYRPRLGTSHDFDTKHALPLRCSKSAVSGADLPQELPVLASCTICVPGYSSDSDQDWSDSESSDWSCCSVIQEEADPVSVEYERRQAAIDQFWHDTRAIEDSCDALFQSVVDTALVGLQPTPDMKQLYTFWQALPDDLRRHTAQIERRKHNEYMSFFRLDRWQLSDDGHMVIPHTAFSWGNEELLVDLGSEIYWAFHRAIGSFSGEIYIHATSPVEEQWYSHTELPFSNMERLMDALRPMIEDGYVTAVFWHVH
jgi:hypothetical protein